jgi:hypothetical protein
LYEARTYRVKLTQKNLESLEKGDIEKGNVRKGDIKLWTREEEEKLLALCEGKKPVDINWKQIENAFASTRSANALYARYLKLTKYNRLQLETVCKH